MRKILALSNQSLFDIANQEYGSISAAFEIAVLNQMSVTDLPYPGQVLQLPDLEFERDIATYFKGLGIKIATVTRPFEQITVLEDYSFPGEFPFSF